VSYLPIDQKFIGVVNTETEMKLRKNCEKIEKLTFFLNNIFKNIFKNLNF
jgi:hypothetical protein